MTVSDKIIKWVDENKAWFKVSYLAEICKVDRGNFTRYMQTEIPEKCLPTIMEFIMPLGFTLGKMVKENNKPVNKEGIPSERSESNKKVKSQNPVPPGECENQNQELISQYETELSGLGEGQFAKARKKWLTNKLAELKSKM